MNNVQKLGYTGLLLVTTMLVGCQTAVQEEAPTETTTAAPVTETPVTAATAGASQYQVERGDSLWGISGKAEIYGNPYQWPLIYKSNADKIRDADLIYPGQIFDIETNPSAAEVARAVNHARTRGRWSLGVVEPSDKAYLNQY